MDDLPELCDTTNEQLFDKILHNKQHFLHYLLPPPLASLQSYNLCIRPHSQLLPQRSGHLTDSTLLFACHIKTFIDDIKHAMYILLKDKLIILLYTFIPHCTQFAFCQAD